MQLSKKTSGQPAAEPRHSFRSNDFRRFAAAALCASTIGLRAVAAEIDGDTTQPVATSTANAGSPDDLVITDDGEIDLSGQSGSSAVTVDSDNTITNSGAILAEDTDDIVGIRITGDRQSDITNDGAIQLFEDYDREDTDDDDDLDGPLAIGENRIGILLEAGDTLSGDIVLTSNGSISVEGNASAGVLVEGTLDGAFRTDGSISVVGSDALGVALGDAVSGDVLISGSVSAQGENATGVRLGGDVGGTLTVESSVTSTGFTSAGQTNYVSPTNTTEDTPPVAERLDADDLYDNHAGLHVGGSVAGGILINGSVDDFTSEEDEDDETKDTLDDFDENRSRGSITSYGSGAALEITPDTAGEDLVLGPVIETVRDTLDDDEDDDTDEVLAEFELNQGLINRGSITANGINIGFDATAVDISGRADGTASVIVEGGILNRGTISATAYEADAVAIRLGAGADVGEIENTGTISSTTYTRQDNDAVALLAETGSTISELVNTGSISANSVGYGGQVAAVRDESDSLTSIENLGSISARLSSDGREDDETGSAIAIDLSTQTVDAVITQRRKTPVEDVNGDDEIDADDVTTPSITGDIVFGSGNDTLTALAGTISGDVHFGDGDAVFRLQNADLAGDTTFDGDEFEFTLSGAEVTGDIDLASASGLLSISGGSEFEGNLYSDTGSTAVFEVADSDIAVLEDTRLYLSSLQVTGNSALTFAISPQDQRSDPYITVAGTAAFGSATTIKPSLKSIVSSDFSALIVEAGDLQFEGELSTVATDNLPWIYNVDLVTAGPDNNQLTLDFRLKTADELGFDVNQASAFDAVLDVAVADNDVGEAFASITEGTPFQVAYDLLLPQRTEASTRYLETQQNAVLGALSNHLELISSAPSNGASVWVEETFSRIDAPADSSTPGYDGRGIGLAAGADRKLLGIDAVGVMVAMNNGRFEEKTGGVNPVTTTSLGIGGYASERFGLIDAQIAAQYADVSFSSLRRVRVADYSSDVTGEWDGSSLSASARLTSEFGKGLFRVAPYTSLDYFQLNQDGYTERASNGLNLQIGGAETDRLTASAGLSFAAEWIWSQSGYQTGARQQPGEMYGGQSALVRTSFDLGYRSVLSSTPYRVNANFVGYDKQFELAAQDETGDALTAGFSFLAASDVLSVRVGAGGEFAQDATTLTASANFRVRF